MCGFSCFFWGGGSWNFFGNFYEINSSQNFSCIAKILVLMVTRNAKNVALTWCQFACPRLIQDLRYRLPFTGVIWAFRPKVRKKSRKGGPKKSENNRKSTIFQVFFKFLTPFSTFFWLFRPPGAKRPGNPLRDFFRTSGQKAQMTRVNGQRYRNSRPFRKCVILTSL